MGTVTHAKTNTIADWTQADVNAQIALGNLPAGTVLSNLVLSSDWNHSHNVVGTASTIAGYDSSGASQDITVGSGLQLVAGVLSSTSGGGSVTTVSVVSANGVSGSVATATTTPAITITLGAITPTSVAAVGTVTGSNLSNTNSGDVTLAGENYITIAGQVITAAAVNLSGSNVTSTLPETKGGTNQSTYTLGDTLYASAANTLSKLAGNITTTRKFIRQTGNGAVSAAPAWDTVTSTDVGLSAVTNDAQTKAAIVPNTAPSAGQVLVGNAGGTAYAPVTIGTDATLSSAGALTIANNAVSNAKFRQGVAMSVVGVTGNATANVADITGTSNQVLVINNAGTALAFGAVNVASSSAVTGIMAAANGGTANGFTAFSGPATSTKTFTLPNASATILTDNAAVTVAQGGTGLQTLTAHAVMLGEGTSNVAFATIGTSGRLLIDQGAGADPSFNAMSGDAAITNAGAISLAASTYNAVPSAQVVTVTSAGSPYTVLATDYIILVDTSGGAVTLNLPSPATKKRIKIKDIKGTFGTNQCTVARNASEKIEGLAASLKLYANWGNYELQSNGTDWFKISGATNWATITYGTSGGTFTCPAGVTQVLITGRGGSGGGGGGGAGGGGSTAAAAEGGGGGGPGGSCYTVTKQVTVVPNTAYTGTVGAGGTAGTAGTVTAANAAGTTGGNGGVGGNGGTTSFGTLFSTPGGLGGGPANGGALASTGAGGYAGEGMGYFGVSGAAGGVTNTQGGSTTQQFLYSPWAADSSSSNGTGGAAGGASGGGGGGAGGIPFPGDATPANGVTAGNGGASAGNGAAGSAAPATNAGCGGFGGSGGGGGGVKAATGSTGGAGIAGAAGSDGFLTVSWQE